MKKEVLFRFFRNFGFEVLLRPKKIRLLKTNSNILAPKKPAKFFKLGVMAARVARVARATMHH